MTRKPRPTRAGFLRYMKEARHDVDSLDAVSLGNYWRGYVRSLEYDEKNKEED